MALLSRFFLRTVALFSGFYRGLPLFALFLLPAVSPVFLALSPNDGSNVAAVIGVGVVLFFTAVALALENRRVPRDFFQISLFTVVLALFFSVSVFIEKGSGMYEFSGLSFGIGTPISFICIGCALLSGMLLARILKGLRIHSVMVAGCVLSITAYLIGIVAAIPSLTVLAGGYGSIQLISAIALLCIVVVNASRQRVLPDWILFPLAILSAFVIVLGRSNVFALLIGLIGCISVFLIFFRSAGRDHAWRNAIPFLGLFGLLIISGVFGAASLVPSQFIPEHLREIHPSLQATLVVDTHAYGTSSAALLFGSGPNSFGNMWNNFKPDFVNISPYFDTDFSSGSSLLPTLALTNGLLVVLLVVLTAFVALGPVIIAARQRVLAQDAMARVVIRTALVWLALFGACLFSPSLTFFSLIALCIGALIETNPIHESKEVATSRFSSRIVLIRIVTTFVLIGISSSLMYIGVRRYEGLRLYNSGLSLAKSGSTTYEAMRTLLNQTLSIVDVPEIQLTAAEIDKLDALSFLAHAGSSPSEGFRSHISDIVSKGLMHLDIARKSQLGNFRISLLRGDLQQILLLSGDSSMLAQSLQSYRGAARTALASPVPPYMQAALSYHAGNMHNAYSFLNTSLEIKSDYTPAIQLLQTMNAAPHPEPTGTVSLEDASSTEASTSAATTTQQ